MTAMAFGWPTAPGSGNRLADWVGRCGVELTALVARLREVLKQHSVLHADETPVAM